MKIVRSTSVRLAAAVTTGGLAMLAPVLISSATVGAPAANADTSCGNTAWAAPMDWGPVTESNCSLAGSPGWQACYSVDVQGDASPVAIQVRGYDDQMHEQWYGIPNTGGCVPWGNVLAVPALKAFSSNILGANVSWTSP